MTIESGLPGQQLFPRIFIMLDFECTGAAVRISATVRKARIRPNSWHTAERKRISGGPHHGWRLSRILSAGRDGAFWIPEVLRPYIGAERITKKKAFSSWLVAFSLKAREPKAKSYSPLPRKGAVTRLAKCGHQHDQVGRAFPTD